MLSTVLGDFTETWTTAADLNAATVTDSWQVLVTVGMLWAMMVFAVTWGHFADSRDAEKMRGSSGSSDLSKKKKVRVQKSAFQNRRERRISSEVSEEVQMIDSSLPAALASKTFPQRLLEENRKNHRWLAVVFYFSPRFSRMLRILSLGNSIVVMLFLQAVVRYGLL
jgi:hypothetical protein